MCITGCIMNLNQGKSYVFKVIFAVILRWKKFFKVKKQAQFEQQLFYSVSRLLFFSIHISLWMIARGFFFLGSHWDHQKLYAKGFMGLSINVSQFSLMKSKPFARGQLGGPSLLSGMTSRRQGLWMSTEPLPISMSVPFYILASPSLVIYFLYVEMSCLLPRHLLLFPAHDWQIFHKFTRISFFWSFFFLSYVSRFMEFTCTFTWRLNRTWVTF